jgi:xylulokinase
MAHTEITIGIDIGTTGVKGAALDVDLGIIAHAHRPTALSSPKPGWAEASTALWFDNAVAVINELVRSPALSGRTVAAIATTGMVPAVVAVNSQAHALRPAILQNDTRATVEVEQTAKALRASGVLHRTGSPVTQQSVGPTAVWLQRNEPHVWADTAALVGSYDWVLAALGAPLHVEKNWAIESGLYELDGQPFTSAVSIAHLEEQLVPVLPPGTVVGTLSSRAAAATGLPTDTALVVGGADHVLSAYGAGLADEGDWLVKLGGAGDILAVATTPVVDDRFYLDAHPIDGLWLPNGCMATSGSLVRWVQETLNEDNLQLLDRHAAQRNPAELLCLPYFLGEKSPLNDPDLRGVFAGMHLGHDRYDLYRSSLEGIAFGFRHNAAALRDRGLRLETATITNGGSTSSLWKQIHADVLGAPLRTVVHHSGAAFGAAVAAAIGVQALDGWDAVSRYVRMGETIDPNPAVVAHYDNAYSLWRELAKATAPTMRALARR